MKVNSRLTTEFDNEAHSQTDVGSTSIGTQTGVESAAGEDEGQVEGEVEGDEVMGNEGYSRELWEEEDMMSSFLETRKTRNLAISLYYEAALGSPSKEHWLGKHGTVAHIMEVFN